MFVAWRWHFGYISNKCWSVITHNIYLMRGQFIMESSLSTRGTSQERHFTTPIFLTLQSFGFGSNLLIIYLLNIAEYWKVLSWYMETGRLGGFREVPEDERVRKKERESETVKPYSEKWAVILHWKILYIFWVIS